MQLRSILSEASYDLCTRNSQLESQQQQQPTVYENLVKKFEVYE